MSFRWFCAFFQICPALAPAVILTCTLDMPKRQTPGFEFAFCSDIHYDSNGRGAEYLNENLEKWRRQLDSCDFLAVGGDLTRNGAEAEFAALHKALLTLDKTVYTLPGNHDLVLKGAPDDRFYRRYFGGKTNSYFVKHKQVGLLFLDLSETGKAHVTVATRCAGRWRKLPPGSRPPCPSSFFRISRCIPLLRGSRHRNRTSYFQFSAKRT